MSEAEMAEVEQGLADFKLNCVSDPTSATLLPLLSPTHLSTCQPVTAFLVADQPDRSQDGNHDVLPVEEVEHRPELSNSTGTWSTERTPT